MLKDIEHWRLRLKTITAGEDTLEPIFISSDEFRLGIEAVARAFGWHVLEVAPSRAMLGYRDGVNAVAIEQDLFVAQLLDREERLAALQAFHDAWVEHQCGLATGEPQIAREKRGAVIDAHKRVRELGGEK